MLLKCEHCGKETSWNPCDDEDDSKDNEKASAEVQDGDTDKGHQDHNWLCHVPKVLLIGGIVVAAPCVVASLAGFGAAGIVGGSVAAGIQSGIGNVAAGSAFAILQSWGATGLFLNGASAGAAAIGVGAVAGVLTNDDNKDDENKGDENRKGSEDDEKKDGDKQQGDDDNNDNADEDSKPAPNEPEGERGSWTVCDHCGKRFFVGGRKPAGSTELTESAQ
jgi:hypothetical protein